MKKIYIFIYCWMICFAAFTQNDTVFTLTSTASNAASWLRNLNPAPGTGRIGILQGEMGPLVLGQNARSVVDTSSVYDLYNNPAYFTPALTNAQVKLSNYFVLARKMGVFAMRGPESFSWALIEPVPGTYSYLLTDTIVTIANRNGVNVIATINPYADSSMECNNLSGSGCTNLFGSNAAMYFINNGRTGKICDGDTTRYKTFIQNLVERYDYDGIDDMPGLTQPVIYYEFNNEPEGPCGNFIGPTNYGHDLRMTYDAMKAACSECQLLHGGTIGRYDSTFWKDFYDIEHDYFEVANLHVNEPRDTAFNFDFLTDQLHFVEEKTELYGKDYDIWITEFGIYQGSPHGPDTTPYISEESQAARYAKLYAYGLANNIEVVFYDQQGDTISGIGGSALLYRAGMLRQAKLCLLTLWLMNYKFNDIDSAQVNMFSTDVDFSTGHVRVFKSGMQYDIVWGLGSLPPDITGEKQCTDIYGNISIQDVSTLSFPLSSNPLIIEDVSTGVGNIKNETVKVNVFPNPANDEMHVNIRNVNFSGNNYFLRVYDIIGQLKISYKIVTLDNTFNISDLSGGFYLYDILQNDIVVSNGKFIKE